MTTDNDIKQLFDNFRPTDVKDDFVQQLDKKLQVVDIVRGEQCAVSRFYALFATICFVSGLIVGAGLLYLALFYPMDWTILESWHISTNVVLFMVQYGNVSLSLAACMAIILGALPWINSDSGLSVSIFY